MSELNFNKVRKTFIVNGKEIEKDVFLESYTAYTRDGKPTMEVVRDYPEEITILYDYDDYGNQIHSKASSGAEFWHKFDELGHEVYMRTAQGDEVVFDYDDAGNRVYSKSSRGFESQYRYNNKNQKIVEFESRFGDITLFQYNRENKLIRSLCSDGSVEKYNYDSVGNLVLKITSYGSIEYYEYDSKGNILYSFEAEIDDDDIDVENFVLDLKSLEDKEELFYEYEFYPNGKIQKQYIYQLGEE